MICYNIDRFYRSKVRLSYVPVDDVLMGLSGEEMEIRSSFRNFFESELGPHVKDIDSTDDFPGFRDYMKKCGEMGILGTTVPEEYGGTNMGYFAHMLAAEENAR